MNANEHKYYYYNSCLFVFIRGFPYPWSPLAPPKAGKPLSSFLFPISGLKVLLFENRKINELKSSIELHSFNPLPTPQSMGLKKQKNHHESKRGDLFNTTGKVSVQICPAEVL
jgi:hypothetical protein